jgi:biopolymer transport protein ExbD
MNALSDRTSTNTSFNMTPIIDVVFLLIIFFMLVCQYIAAENFQVAVPDRITAAKPSQTETDQLTTVTVMFDEGGAVAYAVGAEVLPALDGENTALAVAAAIDKQLANLPRQKRVVSLRCDRNVTFKHAKYALAGISQSSATDIKWAVIRHKQAE